MAIWLREHLACAKEPGRVQIRTGPGGTLIEIRMSLRSASAG